MNYSFRNRGNSKMNEMQAAIGLLQLKKIDEYISSRKKIAEIYDKGLEAVSGVDVLSKRKNSSFSYGYYPIFIDKDQYGMSRDDLYFLLKESGIFREDIFFHSLVIFSLTWIYPHLAKVTCQLLID